MTVIISIELPGLPPLPNVTRTRHWHENSDEARTWRSAAYFTAKQALRESRHPEDFPLRRAVIEYIITSPTDNLDPDNCASALKPVLDGIVEAGVLTSDSFRTIGSLSIVHATGPKSLRVDVRMGAQ